MSTYIQPLISAITLANGSYLHIEYMYWYEIR